MSLEDLITHYGYAAIAIGTFLEGETVLILGGFSAHRGYLHLPSVIAFAFIGTFCGDQLFYYLGRIKGQSWLESKPKWKPNINKAFALLNRHQVAFVVGFRFLYGLRTIAPFVIGTSGIPPARFFALNFIGALTWSATIGSLGYLFGQAVEALLGDIKKYELWFFLVLVLLGMTAWFIRRLSKPKSG